MCTVDAEVRDSSLVEKLTLRNLIIFLRFIHLGAESVHWVFQSLCCM